MLSATFYKFSKRVNSTKRPSDGTVIEVLLKEPTDIYHPTLIISSSAYGQYNYFKFMDNYYWIEEEVAQPNNYIAFTGKIDAMATCADDIKATTAVIERANTGSALLHTIYDTTIPKTVGKEIVQSEYFQVYDFYNDGCFVLSVIGGLTGSISAGGVSTSYAISGLTLRNLNQILVSDDFYSTVVQFFYDPFSAIVGCTWFPLGTEDFGESRGEIIIGNYNTGIHAVVVTDPIFTGTTGIALALQDDFTYYNPYTTIDLYLPFLGVVNLTPDDFKVNKRLNIEWSIDLLTGAMAYTISDGGNKIVTHSTSCGVSCPVGNVTNNWVIGAAGAIGSAINGNIIGVGASLIMAAKSRGSVSGAFGTRAGNNWKSAQVVVTRSLPSEDISARGSVLGFPYGITRKIGDIAGYIQCNNASVESDKNSSIIEECNNYLNSGAFIE